jgi:protocatechuate 3,4-dioxygenase beta subunit
VRLLTACLIALSAFAAQLAPLPPQPPPNPQGLPPRDVVPRAEPTGTAAIRGRVVAADTGSPIRRASVTLISMAPPVALTPPPPPGQGRGAAPETRTVTVNGVAQTVTTSVSVNVSMRPRTMTTDAQGGFEFTGLPAGSYRVMANAGQYSAAYLSGAYGAKRPNTPMIQDQGAAIDLVDGQRFDKATISLQRGGVITGRVTDENGDALARVQVYTMFLMAGSSRPQRTGSTVSTDDLGQFRLFGLQPAEYLVVAEARGPTFVQPNAPPEREEDKIGFMTTYFPGTADEASAQRVRVRAGGETPGVEIRLVSGRLFTISGMVLDSQGRASARTSGQLMKSAVGFSNSYGFSTDEQGRFQMKNIAPGAYRLIVRGRNPGGPEVQADQEMAVMPLAVNSDLEGVTVVTGTGPTITGTIVFEQGPPQLPPGQPSLQIRVSATPGDPQNLGGMPMPQAALVTPDLTFTMKNVFAEVLLRTSAPGQYLKAVTLNGEDITDTPREFKTGDRVTLVMTSRVSTLEGTVTDAKGSPVTDASIVVFSEDKTTWRFNSTKIKRSGVDQAGHFRVMGVLPGRYFAIAVPRDRMAISTLNQDTAFFEQLSKEATTLVVGEDEQRQVDLRLAAPAGGG